MMASTNNINPQEAMQAQVTNMFQKANFFKDF
jgi:hypothetical protein